MLARLPLIVTLGVLAWAQGRMLAQEIAAPPNNCLMCHGDAELWEDDQKKFHVTEKLLQSDVHWTRGLRCADCHGGDPAAEDYSEAHDEARGFRTVKAPRDVPGFCGHCHADPVYMKRFNPAPRTDQLAEYWTSGHGKRLKEADDPKVATCVSCHSHHDIKAVKDLESPVYPTRVAQTCNTCHGDPKVMEGRLYNGRELGHAQYALWKNSVHGRAMLEKEDISAPTCNDCHGNHGATPPGAPSVAYVCGQCHLSNAELFLASPHRDAYREAGFPECETCHSNHDVERPTEALLAPGDVNICAVCHLEDTPGRLAAQTMYENIEALKSSIGGAREVLTSAEEAGMPVNEPLFLLSEADDSLVHVRTAVHSLSIERVHEVSDEGQQKAGEALQAGLDALDELQFRRRGLFLSLIFIAALAIGLYMKIREADRRWKAAENGSEAGSGHP